MPQNEFTQASARGFGFGFGFGFGLESEAATELITRDERVCNIINVSTLDQIDVGAKSVWI